MCFLQRWMSRWLQVWAAGVWLIGHGGVGVARRHHGGRGPGHAAGMAADGTGRRARHAAHRPRAALHAPAHVRQRGPLLWDVSVWGTVSVWGPWVCVGRECEGRECEGCECVGCLYPKHIGLLFHMSRLCCRRCQTTQADCFDSVWLLPASFPVFGTRCAFHLLVFEWYSFIKDQIRITLHHPQQFRFYLRRVACHVYFENHQTNAVILLVSEYTQLLWSRSSGKYILFVKLVTKP